MDQSVSVDHQGSPTPHEDIQDLSHRNETFSTKFSITSTPRIQAITVDFGSQQNPNTRYRQNQDRIITLWKPVTRSNRGRTKQTLPQYP